MNRLVWLFLSFFLLLACAHSPDEMIRKLDDDLFQIKYRNYTFGIDAENGGRIISARLEDTEFLLQDRKGLENWGSTFWPAPQSLWNWPPPKAIFRGKYSSELIDDQLVLESTVDDKYRLKVKKIISFDPQLKALKLEYEIINMSDAELSVGPWEVTCVPLQGAKVFFANGSAPKDTESTLEFEKRDGVAWFDHTDSKLMPMQKLFNNAPEGWLAYINQERNLFVKSFQVIDPEKLAPGQGNIEVYINDKLKYIELENHGTYETLKPGKSLKYKVYWYITKLPDSMKVEEPNDQLLEFVHQMIK